jgi:purine-binding chemotaxis protein CheW
MLIREVLSQMNELMQQKYDIEQANKVDELSTQQYLTFKMANDEYGVEILAVQEIHGWVEPRPMPGTPEYIKGVIDWRGAVVPLVDLRIRFNYSNITYDNTTVVIVLKSFSSNLNKEFLIAVTVDAVSDVHDIAEASMKAAPELGKKIDTRYIKGMANINNSMVIILEIQRLVNFDELDNYDEQ